MKKKAKLKNDAYWLTVPDELRFMCLAEYHTCGNHYCIKPIIEWLMEHIYDCDQFITGKSPLDVIRWIDIVMESCLFPLEFHEDDWLNNIAEISTLLNREQEILERIAPADYKTGYRTCEDSNHKTSIIGLAQRLNVYFCALAVFSEEWRNLQESLEKVLSDTKRNLLYLLNHENAERLSVELEYHYPGTDVWATISWVAKEYFSHRFAEMILVQFYEEYILFLHEQKNKLPSSRACIYLISKAEENLESICDSILDQIDDEMEDVEEEVPSLLEAKKQYEDTIRKSKERQKTIACLECRTNQVTPNVDDAGSYHAKCGPFTKKLKKLMKDYPSVPVIIPQLCSTNSDDVECKIVDVFDRNRVLRERVIAIWAAEDSLPIGFHAELRELEDDGGLPF